MIPSWALLAIAFSGIIVAAFLAFRDQLRVSETKELELQKAIASHAKEIEHLKDSKPYRDALRIVISKLKTKLEKIKEETGAVVDSNKLAVFLRESRQELLSAITALEPFIKDGDALHKAWLKYDAEFATDEERGDTGTAFILKFRELESKKARDVAMLQVENAEFDPIKILFDYLEQFDAYGK